MKLNFKKIEAKDLIKLSLVQYSKALTISYKNAIKKTTDQLMLDADHSQSNNEEITCINQYNYLYKNQQKFESKLNTIIQSMPSQFVESYDYEKLSSVLTLVDDDDLEIDLIYKQMEATFDVKFISYYYALEKRLKILFPHNNITKSNMPFGSHSVSWVFQNLLKTEELNSSIKVMIISFLSKELIIHLSAALKIINDIFIQAKILPNLKLKAQKNTSQQPNPNNKKPKLNKKEAIGQNAFDNFQSNELVESIFKLLNKNKLSNTYNKTEYNIEDNLLDQSLTSLSDSATMTLGNIETNKIKELLLKQISHETGLKTPVFSQTQENTIDVMGMFYDKVKVDNDIDKNLLSSLNSINIPLIRTAISDKDFFKKEDHPAREYLEKIIFASQKWHGTTVVKNINKFSANLAGSFDGTPESFVQANEMLDSYLRLTEKRSIKAEKKWIDTLKGKEKLAISRNMAQATIDALTEPNSPNFIEDILNHVIKDTLTLSLLRNGKDSLQWKKHIEETTILAKLGNPEKIKDISAKQKVESLHHLDKSMEKLGFTSNDRRKTLNNFQNFSQAAKVNKINENIEIAEIPSITEKRNYTKLKPGSVKLEDLRPLNNKEKTELTKLKLTAYGSIFDFFINQQRDKIRRKLSWFSNVSNKALFVSLLGNKPHEQSLNSLAMDLARNNISIVQVETKKYFNDALRDIFQKLKNKLF